MAKRETVNVKFWTDNASFGTDNDERREEICQTLVSVIDSIRRGKDSGLVIDVNGNRIGEFSIGGR